MDYFLSKYLAALILPPAGPLLLGALGLILLAGRRRQAAGLLTLSLGSLWLLCSPFFALWLANSLQIYPALSDEYLEAPTAQAIVVLGGGRYASAPEYGGKDTVSMVELTRLRYAATLQRQTGLPVLVSGGTVHPEEQVPEADLMAEVLENDFNVPVRWRESESANTAENAIRSTAILSTEQISHVLLVTSSSHMRRSVQVFTRAGLDVTPAPTYLVASSQPRRGALGALVRGFIPQAWALAVSRQSLHEYLGMAWYWVRGF